MTLLTVQELSKILKAKPSTIYQWASEGRIPCFKLNGLLRFTEEDIRVWMEESKKHTPTV